MRVAALDLDERRALRHDRLELLHREVDVGERDVGREEQAVLVRVADLFVDPAVERPRVRVHRVDAIGELELDVVRGVGIHERGLDALAVHQREAEIAVAVRLRHVAELGDELLALVVVETLQRVQPVEQLARHEVGLLGGVRRREGPQLRLLLGDPVDEALHGELRRLTRVERHVLALVVLAHRDREVFLVGIDVLLVQAQRLVEVVVGIEDLVGELIGHRHSPLYESDDPCTHSA